MLKQPKGFLVNLAILKVNWDEQRDIVHNFMPLIGHAISKIDGSVITVPQLKVIIKDIAQFDIASGALETMIRRAAKPPYSFVKLQDKTYTKTITFQQITKFEEDRLLASSRFNELEAEFQVFCRNSFAHLPAPDTGQQFFSMLFDVAPHVIESAAQFLSDNENGRIDEFSLKYRTAKFIKHIIDTNSPHVNALQSYFQGAVLAESFYYSSPENVRTKFRDVKVYYDTDILSRIMGFCSIAERDYALELHEMVKRAKAKPCIFRHTQQELFGIFDAARHHRRRGLLVGNRPDDIFGWLSEAGATVSDIELFIVSLEEKILELGIKIEDTPIYTDELGIDEQELKKALDSEIRYLNPVALERDIRSITAIYRLRAGQQKKFLESCKAIFVTKNINLAFRSTRFFNENYLISDAPICISDHVFGMLIWLKTVDKKAEIPPDILVANALAALNPDQDLWTKYLEELSRLKERGDINESNYHLLAHSLEARQALMEITDGEVSAFVVGSVVEVLEKARSEILDEAAQTISRYESNVIALTGQKADADSFAESMYERLASFIFWPLSIIIFLVFVVLASKLQNVNTWELITGRNNIASLTAYNGLMSLLAVFLLIISIGNLLMGWSFGSPIKSLARLISRFILGSRSRVGH